MMLASYWGPSTSTHQTKEEKLSAALSLKTQKDGTTLEITTYEPAGMDDASQVLDYLALRHKLDEYSKDCDNDWVKLAEKKRSILNNKETRRRFVCNYWPRDPKGEILRPENSEWAKMTPDGIQLWGATLLDFYRTSRFPVDPKDQKYTDQLSTVSTASKLLRWMDKMGETYAKDQLSLARREPDPEVIEPFDIAELIQEQEQIAVRHALESTLKKQPPRPSIGAPDYPMPWPRPAYSGDKDKWPEPPMLEKLLPLSTLPKTLIVHDPWNTVDGQRKSSSNAWKPPMRGTKALRYRLQLSRLGEERAKKEIEDAQKRKEDEDKVFAAFIADPHTRNTIPENGLMISTDDEADLWTDGAEVNPRIFCVIPPPPSADPNTPAHLRLSPCHYLGSGHHSVLYDAEFELPRDHLADRPICRECVVEAAVRICEEEDAADPNNKWAKAKGKITVTRTQNKGRTLVNIDKKTGKYVQHCLERPSESVCSHYEGPIRVVHVGVDYFGPFDKPCRHFDEKPEEIRYPPTATVRVAAKLSNPGDNHLAAESKNYEAFPVHFFQHWSGYSIPLGHAHPVPVGAIAPQYYGYYVFDGLIDDMDPPALGPLTEEVSKLLEESEDAESPNKRRKYYSPILLMENCGKHIESDKLSVDDREQAMSLFSRFRHGGWGHFSLYQRNIVMKPGPINLPHSQRLANSKKRGGLGEEWTFRLIDFGRSRTFSSEDHPCYDKDAKEGSYEEAQKIWRWMYLDTPPDH